MANDIMDTLKGMLGDNAEEKIQGALQTLQGTSDNNEMSFGDDNDFANQIKNIVGQMSSSNDRRSNLLMSLKPFMRNERKQSIDNLVKVLNLTRLSGFFK